jgi:hypothetical protein
MRCLLSTGGLYQGTHMLKLITPGNNTTGTKPPTAKQHVAVAPVHNKTDGQSFRSKPPCAFPFTLAFTHLRPLFQHFAHFIA